MSPLVVAQVVVAGTQDLLFAIAMGSLACDVIQERHGRLSLAVLGRLRLGTLYSLALASIVYLWLQAAGMSGSPLGGAGAAMVTVVTQSHFGIAWAIGFAGVVIASLANAQQTRPAWLIVAAGAIIYASGKAAASHAADNGDFTLREVVHIVHLCATALWAGSVIVSAYILHRVTNPSSVSPFRVVFCARLSHLATIALGAVIVTGVFNVLQDTAHLDAPLLDVRYGHVLMFKLVFVVLAVMLGGCNRMIYLPRLKSTVTGDHVAFLRAQRRFGWLLIVEAAVMIVVVLAAAMLGHTSPSSD